MGLTLRDVLVFIAFLLFILDAFGVKAIVGLTPLGLALLTMVYLFRL